MKILLIGHGKMGQSIEKLAISRGHEIAGIINIENADDLQNFGPDQADVAIEFSQPDVAFNNITSCVHQGVPVISGTTGWLDQYDEVVNLCKETDGTFLYASNFSLGVNLFFKLNQWLSKLMKSHNTYDVSMSETHHIHKKDAPSGTAITLAEGIIETNKQISGWTQESSDSNQVNIESIREGEVPGTHVVKYKSGVDQIEIKHEAFSREGFVLGAVLVAEWIKDKKGAFTMDDFLADTSDFD